MPDPALCRRIERMAKGAAAHPDYEDSKLEASRDPSRFIGVLSTGERLVVCLVLNRSDWLNFLGYTMLDAIDRVGEEWMAAAHVVAAMWED